MPAHDRAVQFRALDQRGSYEQPTVAAPKDGQLRRLSIFVLDQPLRCSDKVIEHILLPVPHSGQVPRLAELTTATQVGQRIDSASLRPYDGVGREIRCVVDGKTAVP